MTGTIKELVLDRRFGFIRSSNGEELFFHASAVIRGDFASLTVGQAVGFDLEHSQRGTQAANVRLRQEEPISRLQEGK